MLACDYPLLRVFWTLVLFSLFFLVIFTIFTGDTPMRLRADNRSELA
jgi:hypothetical protein